jgi:hypothetical protein
VKVYQLIVEAPPKTDEVSTSENGVAGQLSDPSSPPKNGGTKLPQKRCIEPPLGTLEPIIPELQKLSEVIEVLKQDPRFDGLDVDFQIKRAREWAKKKNKGVTQRFLRYWLDNADRNLEEDDDEELYVSEPYYSWEGWTEERRRALLELWPGVVEPPPRWDKLSTDLKEQIETRVKEGWA